MSSSMGPQLKRAAVMSALHQGMTGAVHYFSAWTGGEYLCDWGIEGFMTSACARRLAREATTVGSKSLLTLEQRFADIIDFSGRQPGRGRPTDAARRLAAKMSGRVDMVLWNVDGTPRAMIEVKRDAGVKGLTTDADRVIDFVKSAGRTYKGWVRYGLVATVVGGPAGKGQDNVKAKAAKPALDRMTTNAQ